MNNQNYSVIDKVNQLEKNLQELKVSLLGSLTKTKVSGVYKDTSILKEVKSIRKKLWNEKYSKSI